MNKISKILVSVMGMAFATIIAVAPVKANTLEQDQAWVQAQAENGMKMGQAHLANIAAQAASGMASGQAYLNAAAATMDKDQAALATQAAAGLAQAQAYLDAATATMNKDQAYVATQAAAGMAQGEAYLAQRAAEGKKGMVSGATEAVRVAKANLDSVKELAKVNPQFADKIPAAEAALAQAEAFLATLQ